MGNFLFLLYVFFIDIRGYSLFDFLFYRFVSFVDFELLGGFITVGIFRFVFFYFTRCDVYVVVVLLVVYFFDWCVIFYYVDILWGIYGRWIF